MKTNLMYMLAGTALLFSCSQPKNIEAQKALKAYTHFVDSIAQWNEVWKTQTDTLFVETPIDPNDPSKVVVDTIVSTPEEKAKSSIKSDNLFGFGKQIEENYQQLNDVITAQMNNMDDIMKKEYEQSKAIYEGLK